MIKIREAESEIEARLLASALEFAGIPTKVTGESLCNLAGAIPVSETYPSIWVPEEKAAKAVAILNQEETGEVE